MNFRHHALHVSSRVLVFVILASSVWAVVQGIKSNDNRRIEEPQIVTLIDEDEPEEVIIEEEPEVVEIEEYYEESVEIPELPDTDFLQDDLLGLDADASSGFDQFGLVAKRGGTDLLKSGGKTIASDLARVKSLIEQHLHASFESKDALKRKVYSIVVKFWIDENGFVEQVDIVNTTGDMMLDNDIEYALRNIPPFTSKILDIPQPISIRIFTRNF